MQHRQLRLGDIVDDYCPRERRLTNHAVVAMVGPDIKQTRCTTCDTEHEYKHAKVPSSRKKKESAPALYKQVLASAQPEAVRAADATEAPQTVVPAAESEPVQPTLLAANAENAENEAPESANADESIAQGEATEAEGGDDEGPVHRRLIRATLPRPEGMPPAPRPLPQFTVRQPGKFGNNSRGGRPSGTGPNNRPRTAAPRGAFGRPGGTRDSFSGRPSGGQHHGLQRARPNRSGGRPLRHGKKSPK